MGPKTRLLLPTVFSASVVRHFASLRTGIQRKIPL